MEELKDLISFNIRGGSIGRTTPASPWCGASRGILLQLSYLWKAHPEHFGIWNSMDLSPN